MRFWVVGCMLSAFFAISPVLADDATFTAAPWTANQVLVKAREARGALQPGTFHRTTQNTGDDGDVWRTESYEDGDEFTETVHDGDFTSASGLHQGKSWEQDENGTVTISSDFHERENPFSIALRAPESSSSNIRVLGVTTGEPACVVLELKPGNGLSQRRYYDAKTFLLRRVETTEYDGSSYSVSYDDYRTAYPQNITYKDAHPENGWHGHVQVFERVSPAFANFSIPKNKPVFDMQGRDSIVIPAEFSDDGIIVRVTIAGRGLDFELDSGASSTVIDTAVAQGLGLKISDVRKESFSGDHAEGTARVPDMVLGDLHTHNFRITALRFSHQAGQHKIVGLLGGDFFSSGRIKVDFQHQTVTMLAPSDQPMPAPWVAIPIQTDDLVPRAHAKFNNVDGAFVVDLGAFETMMYQHFFRRFKPNSEGDVIGQVEGVGGQDVDYRRYTFSRFAVGDLEFADAAVIIAQSNKFEEHDYDGLLGRNILGNFNLVFDYQNHELYMQSLVQ